MKFPSKELIEKMTSLGFRIERIGEAKDFSTWGYIFEKEQKSENDVIVVSSATRIVEFLEKVLEKGRGDVLRGIKNVSIWYWAGNRFRGCGSDSSSITIEKEIAKKIKLKGNFRWIDRGWGDFSAELEYEL